MAWTYTRTTILTCEKRGRIQKIWNDNKSQWKKTTSSWQNQELAVKSRNTGCTSSRTEYMIHVHSPRDRCMIHRTAYRPTSIIHDAHSTQFRVQSAAQSRQRERTSKKKNKKEKIYNYSESLFQHSLINKYNHVGWIDKRSLAGSKNDNSSRSSETGNNTLIQ